MSDAIELIWLTGFVQDQYGARLCRVTVSDLAHNANPDYPEYIRADHVNELVAAAYETVALRMDANAAYWSENFNDAERIIWEMEAVEIRAFTPTDATAALAARDARVREAALREAWEKLVCPDPAGKAHSLISYRNGYTQARNDLVAIIAKDTTNG